MHLRGVQSESPEPGFWPGVTVTV